MNNSIKSSTEWRQFELLVSRLEEALKPYGYVFKSPDKLIDYDTNELREVDCSIRFTENNIEKIISVECRKRKGTQDVTWIEQLACKMDSLKLAGTIAVSSKGFSKSAIIKARKRNITLKAYREIKEGDVLDQFREDIQIKQTHREWKLLSIDIETVDDGREVPEEIANQFRDYLTTNAVSSIILQDIDTDEKFSLEQLIETYLDQSSSLARGATQKTFKARFRENKIGFPAFPSLSLVEYIKPTIEINIAEKFLNELALGQYLQAEEVLMEVVSGEIQLSANNNAHFEILFTREKDEL